MNVTGFIAHLQKSFAGDFLSPAGYFFVGWVATYALIGSALYIFEARRFRKTPITLANCFRFCFPKKMFWSRSARLDLAILIFNHYLFFFLVFSVFGKGLGETDVANRIAKGAATLWGFRIPVSNGLIVDVVYTTLVLLIADLGWTVQHILFHKVPRLWEFHKVHHSAEYLSLFTIARLHPLDALSQGWASAVSVGIFMGLVKIVLGYQPSIVLFMNVSVAMAAFRVFGIFRHSPIWISFGPKLSRILCSPAMHHIHHGVEKKHWDKNFSTVFSVWDWIFGTLYIPTEREEMRFGIPPHPSKKYDGFWACMLHPFLPDRSGTLPKQG